MKSYILEKTGTALSVAAVLVTSLLASAGIMSAAPQRSLPEDIRQAAAQLVQVEVERVDHRNIPTFVHGKLGEIKGEPDDQKVKAAVTKALPVFRLNKEELQHKSHGKDKQGNHHYRYNQVKNGLPVIGAEYIVHIDKAGVVYAASGNARSDLALPTKAVIGKEAAEKTALDANPETKIGVKTELVYVVSNLDGSTHLAYQVDLVGILQHDVVFIDAIDGSYIIKHPKLYDAKNRETYSADYGYSLPGTLVRTEGSSDCGDSTLDNLHNNAGIVYDFYAAVFGRDSIDNLGMTLVSIAHYGQGYNNAFWDGSRLTFGDGDGSLFGPFGNALDVVGHELTHGVTERTSGLIYQNESGALNEAMSDILGEACETWHRGYVTDDTWKVGEDAYTPGIPGDALRYMGNPTADGSSADYYPERYTGSADNGGVHWNSGIANLAFKLLATGGTHPRGKTAIVVPGVGIEVAQQVFYLADTAYASSTDGFAQFRIATANAASASGYGSDVVAAVHLAWDAVGVPGGPNQPACDSVTNSGSPTTNSSFVVYANNVRNVSNVIFKAWTDANGQDDLVQTNGVYDSANNRWIGTVNINSHNYQTGSYTIQVYGQGADGQWYLLGSTTVTVNPDRVYINGWNLPGHPVAGQTYPVSWQGYVSGVNYVILFCRPQGSQWRGFGSGGVPQSGGWIGVNGTFGYASPAGVWEFGVGYGGAMPTSVGASITVR